MADMQFWCGQCKTVVSRWSNAQRCTSCYGPMVRMDDIERGIVPCPEGLDMDNLYAPFPISQDDTEADGRDGGIG